MSRPNSNLAEAVFPPAGVSPWTMWQLIDSALPVGGFAHSGGLEAAVQLGEVAGPDELVAFINASLEQAASLTGPFVAATSREPGRLIECDDALDAMLRNTVANAASRTQGQALLATAADVWPSATLATAKAQLKAGAWRGHWPIAFGLTATTLGLPPQDAVDAFLFCQLRGLLSAAVRLGVAGSRQAQRLQADAGRIRAPLLATALGTPIDAAAQTSPVLEMLQAQHARLYSRLFVS